MKRRTFLTAVGSGSVAGLAGAGCEAQEGDTQRNKPAFRFCLNTSTIRGQELGIVDELETAAQAGYDSVEPWLRTIQAYLDGGGTTAELRRRIGDLGLTVESAIDFPRWIVNDAGERAQALTAARASMDILAEIGGLRIAAPPAGATPAGATRDVVIDLRDAAERYRILLEVGEQAGVTVMLEIWGHSANLSRLSEALYVAAECGHPQACVLLDVYHLHRGGSSFEGLKLAAGPGLPVLHFNDYPATPPREAMQDKDRVMPGDGVAPLGQIVRDLAAGGDTTALSLELFNRDYWSRNIFHMQMGIGRQQPLLMRVVKTCKRNVQRAVVLPTQINIHQR